MTDALRQQLAADGLVGPQAALILALAGDMPASATVWSSSATVAELATRLGVSARTVQRHRAALPTLHYLSLSSTARGYLLRIDLSGGALSPLPDPRQSPAKVPPVTPAKTPPYGDGALTAEVLDEIVGWVAQVAAILGDRVPLPPALAALCRPPVTPAKGVTNPRQSDDKATTNPRQTHAKGVTDPRQCDDTDASHTRGEIVRAPAPVSDRSTPYSRTAFSQQASRVPAHEGAEGGQDDLTAWLTDALVDRLGQLVRRVTAIEPGDVEELGAQLLDRLGDPLVVRRLIEDRVLSLRSREISARPESWAQLMRWLLDDASNPSHVTRATAAANAPALAAELAAQPHIAPAPQSSRPQRREPFRPPQFGEVYAEAAARKTAAQAQPAPAAPPTASSPSTFSTQERAELVEQLKSELSMPEHYRSVEAIAYLADALGAEGQRMIAEAGGEVSAELPHPPRPTQAPRPAQPVEAPHAEEPPLTPATGGLPAAIREQLAALHIAPPSGKIDAPRVDPERLWARCLQGLSRLHDNASARGWLTRLEGAPVLIDRHRRVISVELTDSEVDAWCSIDHIKARVAVGEALEAAGARDWRVEVVTPVMGVA